MAHVIRVQTDEQKEAEVERRAQERIAHALQGLEPMIETVA